MLCNFLKSVPASELIRRLQEGQRFEMETPQIVYLIRCEACSNSTHSVEFSAIDGEPEELAIRYKQVA